MEEGTSSYPEEEATIPHPQEDRRNRTPPRSRRWTMSDWGYFYKASADVLSFGQSRNGDLIELLAPKEGFAPRMQKLCEEQLEQLRERVDADPEEASALLLERNTWWLLQELMTQRKVTPVTNPPSARTLLSENPYTPTQVLGDAIMKCSPTLTELNIIREWLQDSAPSPPYSEAATGYWKFTKHRVLQDLRTGSAGAAGGVVTEMDPDAPVREDADGKTLAADDASHEKALSQAIYACIRAGDIIQAIDLCEKAHQPWRAASIRGSIAFEWNALTMKKKRVDESNDGMDLDAPKDGMWNGNRRRKLWKATCIRAAHDPHLTEAERIVYAALCPTLETASILLTNACRTWEDVVWAQVSVLFEEKQNEAIRVLGGGGFWEDGLVAVEKSVREAESERDEDMETSDEEFLDEKWRDEMVRSLAVLSTAPVQDGVKADHPFHRVQLQIMLDQTGSMLDHFAENLADGAYDPNTADYSTMTRFFAHLCLFLQMIDISVSPDAVQIILEAYLQVLEAAGQRDLIALYASALGDNATSRYAAFLTSLDLNTTEDERRQALSRAYEHGLDPVHVAVITANETIKNTLDALPPLTRLPLPSPSMLGTQEPVPNDLERTLARALEWSTAQADTFGVALGHACIVLRYFLGAGRTKLARHTLDSLPQEFMTISEPEEVATEYQDYSQFFLIWDTLDRIAETAAAEPTLSRESKAAWLKGYKTMITQAREQLITLLTTDWLLTGSDVDAEVSGNPLSPERHLRLQELKRIRAIYVPEMIVRLHHLLLDSRSRIPENLKYALELANIVADARYGVADAFDYDGAGRGLKGYLEALRVAFLAGLENGGSDPFRVVLS